MADIYADDYSKKITSAGYEPHGYVEHYTWAKAAAIGDKIYMGIIPAGVDVGSIALVNDALAAGTLSLGFEPIDGSVPAANLTYWLAAQSIATAGRQASIAQPILSNVPLKLVGTIGGAALTPATKLTVIVGGIGRGII